MLFLTGQQFFPHWQQLLQLEFELHELELELEHEEEVQQAHDQSLMEEATEDSLTISTLASEAVPVNGNATLLQVYDPGEASIRG